MIPRSRYAVTVPVGSIAEVLLPKLGRGSGVGVKEGGKTVWAGGKLVGGGGVVAGVLRGAELEHEISIEVGSGSYDFSVHSPASF